MSAGSTLAQSGLYMGPVGGGSSVHYLNVVTVFGGHSSQGYHVLAEELEESVVKIAKTYQQ